ncbi:hypothetical protein BDV95DRAFT_603066 [Massariosphaeria phaeospora]|uniref:Rhodopsin domain-containing protein n=1 Tax=Massariosphaeria phaeospora TaxID=100035 RepID=A0A7C8MDL6_9PLEO|nr:hypothetical protein BDV95DRAFT_603066 [Massariosphaeria phaeospora]
MGNAGSVPAVYNEPARGLTIMFIVLTTVATVSRMIARRLQKVKISGDDYMVIVAYLINLGLLVINLLEVRHGAVSLLAMAKMMPDQKLYMKNLTVALGIFYTLAIIAVKMALLLMYRRIFTMNEPWFRLGWWINFLLLMPCYTVFTFTLLGLQVGKPNQFGQNNTLSKVGSPIGGAINAVSDLMILALPVGYVAHRLTLPMREKAAVMGIFCLGLIATSISIMRVARFRIKRDHHWNPAYGFYNDMILSSAESSVGLMCVCLTVIKPLLRKTRDYALASTSVLASFLSSGSGRSRRSNRARATGSDSIHSDAVSLQSRSTRAEGITRVHEYDIDTKALPPGVTQENIQLEHIRPWDGK